MRHEEETGAMAHLKYFLYTHSVSRLARGIFCRRVALAIIGIDELTPAPMIPTPIFSPPILIVAECWTMVSTDNALGRRAMFPERVKVID